MDFRTFFTGIAMGAADVVPGVSGGTIAFISGIYERLLESIRRINPTLISMWRRQGVGAVMRHVDAVFLLTLFGGILVSIITLARVISYLLTHHPIPVWSFFFGLILISVNHIAKQFRVLERQNLIALLIGLGLAWYITVANPLLLEPSLINILFGGMLAICAMILPGISGSFILLLLGLYAPVLGAVKEFDILVIAVFATGCILGLLSFSHFLSFMLKRFHSLTLAFLCGLMLGTLGKIWPWKIVLTWRTRSNGEQVPLMEEIVTPWQFETMTGGSAQIPMALICLALGVLLVWMLERYNKN